MSNDRSFALVDEQTSFQSLDDDDIVVKVSQAIFDDFHSLITSDLPFVEVIKGLYDTCNSGIESIRKVSAGTSKGDPTLSSILSQLCEERNAYYLILCLYEAETTARNKLPKTGSHLENLLIKDAEFRTLHTLLRWVENKDIHQPHGFTSALDLENINVERICTQLCSWNRNQDLEMVLTHKSTLKPQFEESITHLFQLVLAYLRCGRVDEAIDLANQAGCFTLAGLLDTRNALFENALTPTDTSNENYGFADNKVTFKHVARKTIAKIPDTGHQSQLQHIIWAALSGTLPPLLTYASCTDDRLWSYLNCAVEAIFDEQVVQNVDRKFFNDDDLPRTASAIFQELFRAESSAVYRIYGSLAVMQTDQINGVLGRQLAKNQNLPAHVARFYAHLVLLLKMMGKKPDGNTIDLVISHFVDVLISLNQFVLAPYYLSQVSEEVQKRKLIQLLRCIANETTRKEVLARASECGIDPNDLCLSVYRDVKKETVFSGSERQVTHMISELVRAWRWLTYNGRETIYDALLEANHIIRKLFVMGRMAELVELIQFSGNDLSLEVEKAFAEEPEESPRKPSELEKAQREYQGYVEYFEATEAYNIWLAHVEKPIPKLPEKLTDENWARLDMKRRAEYELSVKEARESLQRYEQISNSLRANAVTLLENILKHVEEWLIAVGGKQLTDEEDTRQGEVTPNELQRLREDYLSAVLHALINIHRKAGDHNKVLNVSRIIVDPKYNIHPYLRKERLRKLLKSIAKSGAAILDTT